MSISSAEDANACGIAGRGLVYSTPSTTSATRWGGASSTSWYVARGRASGSRLGVAVVMAPCLPNGAVYTRCVHDHRDEAPERPTITLQTTETLPRKGRCSLDSETGRGRTWSARATKAKRLLVQGLYLAEAPVSPPESPSSRIIQVRPTQHSESAPPDMHERPAHQSRADEWSEARVPPGGRRRTSGTRRRRSSRGRRRRWHPLAGRPLVASGPQHPHHRGAESRDCPLGTRKDEAGR